MRGSAKGRAAMYARGGRGTVVGAGEKGGGGRERTRGGGKPRDGSASSWRQLRRTSDLYR